MERPKLIESSLQNNLFKNDINQINFKHLAPIDQLPVLNSSSNNNYKTTPDFITICRMSEKELKNVENFSIHNEHGRIDFEGVTDLSNLNLDQIVSIKEKRINVYQNDLDHKPPVGHGLNKPAVVHMFNCYPDGEKDLSLFIASLLKTCEDKGVLYLFNILGEIQKL